MPRRKPETEIDALRRRLQEAEETLEAIRLGQVEALVVSTPTGPKVYTLEGADHRYRRLVETMSEGALLVSPKGVILYSNASFADMLSMPLGSLVGRTLFDFVDEPARAQTRGLFEKATLGSSAAEIALRTATGSLVAVHVSMSANEDGEPAVSIIVTNLTAHKQNEELMASERLASSILDQAAEAIVVCDVEGHVVRASRAAREIAGDLSPVRDVYTAFPLRGPTGDSLHPASQALAGIVATSVEMTLAIAGRDKMHVLCNAAPLLGADDEILGCIMSFNDITSRKKAEVERSELLGAERAARAAAERARVEAETSNRSKDEFLATVSHELRTPLNAIVGWARMLSDAAMPPEKQTHAIEVIRRNADAQARLIEDLLDVSRIISGKMILEMHPVEPVRFITSVIETVRPALDAKMIKLTMDIDPRTSSITGDEARLRQVVWNLVSNAAKFTPRHGNIKVVQKRVASEIEICVSDDGQGMDAEFIPYVFDRFRQADGGIARQYGGLGLGLAISRHLVELHGGSIHAESDGVGLGSTFRVRLPIAQARNAIPQLSDVADQQAHSARQPSSPPNALHGLRVLIVEDDEDSRELLLAVLRGCGAEVDGACSGAEALVLFEQARPNIVISDIGMPEMDGYDLIRRLRVMNEGSALVPAIALTAFARKEDKSRALAEGFQAHVAKPIDPTELVQTVGKLARA